MPKEFTLGLDPLIMTVPLARDSVYTAAIESEAGDWPNGTTIALRIGDQVWPATIDGDVASWSVTVLEVNAVIDADVTRAHLYGNDIRWASGPVVVDVD